MRTQLLNAAPPRWSVLETAGAVCLVGPGVPLAKLSAETDSPETIRIDDVRAKAYNIAAVLNLESQVITGATLDALAGSAGLKVIH